MLTNPKSWEVKGSAILEELVQLMHVSADEGALLKELKPHAEAVGPALIEKFYARLYAHEGTAEYLEGVSIERLHSMVKTWFMDIFNGQYDEAYAEQRLNIGVIHVRIGLPVRYPLAMLDIILQHADQVCQHSSNPETARRAFNKVLSLDVALFNQAYEDNQLKHLADLVGGERLARRLLSGEM